MAILYFQEAICDCDKSARYSVCMGRGIWKKSAELVLTRQAGFVKCAGIMTWREGAGPYTNCQPPPGLTTPRSRRLNTT